MSGSPREVRRRSRGRSSERGAVLVMMSVGAAVMMIIAAIVIDLGRARSREQDNDISADQAALAGAAALADGDGGPACDAAWSYLRSNEGIEAAEITVAPSCADLAGSCVASTARSTTAYAIGKVFTFTSPVPVDDPLLEGQPYNAAVDGDPCQRFAVSIDDATSNVFAAGSIDLTSSAVAVSKEGTANAAPASLILLDPTGCRVLDVQGSSEVRALANGSLSGGIAVDSDASSCPSSGTGVESAITLPDNVVVRAEGPDGSINSYALAQGNANRAHFRQPWLPAAKYTLPTAAPARHGRQIVDDTYGAAVADLHDEWATGSGMPPGFQRWTTWVNANKTSFPGYAQSSFGNPCSVNGGPYQVSVPAGNWYLDCPGGLNFQGNGRIVFRGGNVVMEGPLQLGGSTRIAFNCPSGTIRSSYVARAADVMPDCGTIEDDGIVVVRNGNLFGPGDTDIVLWPRTFVYTPNGTFSLTGDKGVYWTAPLAGDFADLLYWSESATPISFAGNKGVDMEGIFFAPNASMTVEGSRHFVNQGVQTFLKSLKLTGNTRFSVYPIEGRHLSLPLPGGTGLVR